VKRRGATVMGVILILTHPLKCIVSRSVCGASVIYMVKQSFQLPRAR
jgi:hypothetical protein